MAQIKTESLNNIFQGAIYKIPDYQRGYSWQTKQLIDFWDDLQNIQNERKHYTGQLSIKRIENENDIISEDQWRFNRGDPIFDVLDGQQRLTTIIILIQSIVDFAREKYQPEDDGEILLNDDTTLTDIEKKYLFDKPRGSIKNTYYFDYYPENPSYRFFHSEIFNDQNVGNFEESFYTHNLLNAKRFFRTNINRKYEAEGPAEVYALFRKVTISLQFIPYEIADDFDVFVAFETMNNRGKPLSNLEILKNRLIFLSTLFDDSQLNREGKVQLRQRINEAWKDIYQNLGRNKDSILTDNDFLRAHWVMYYKYSRNKSTDYIDFLLNQKFVVSNVNQSQQADLSEIDNITEIKDDDNEQEDIGDNDIILEQYEESSLLSALEISGYVEDMQRSSSAWFLLHNPYWSEGNFLSSDEREWLDRISRLGMNYFKPLIMSTLILKKENPTIDLTKLFENIERWLFIAFHLSGARSNWKSSQYYTIAKEVHDKNKTIKDIVNQLETDTKELFDENDVFKINHLLGVITKKFKYDKGYYSWSDRHYFLFEYETSIRTKEKESKLNWGDFVSYEKDKDTIEHIMPQTISEDSSWFEVVKDLDDDKRKHLTHNIGNLLALSRSKNSKYSNDSFQDKKEGRVDDKGEKIYGGYRHGSHSEIQVTEYSSWGRQEIFLRGKLLIEFMSKHWRLNLTEEQVEKLLCLDFLAVDNEQNQTD